MIARPRSDIVIPVLQENIHSVLYGDMGNQFEEQSTAVTEYSEALVRRLIEKIVVYDEKLVVEFKSGLSQEVDV